MPTPASEATASSQSCSVSLCTRTGAPQPQRCHYSRSLPSRYPGNRLLLLPSPSQPVQFTWCLTTNEQPRHSGPLSGSGVSPHPTPPRSSGTGKIDKAPPEMGWVGSSVSTCMRADVLDNSRKRETGEPEEGTSSQSTQSAPSKFENSPGRSPPGSCPDCVKSPSRRSYSVATECFSTFLKQIPEHLLRFGERFPTSNSNLYARTRVCFLGPTERGCTGYLSAGPSETRKGCVFPLSHASGG